MADSNDWIAALRRSHERFAATVAPLDGSAVRAPSYDTEWNIAAVASHLGSQAEIFSAFLAAGLNGEEVPGGEFFQPIWDRWDAKPPEEQVSDSVTANDRLVADLEGLAAEQRDTFSLAMFGLDLDLSGFAALRLGEHAIHTWDVEVALDPSATIAADAVELLIDTVPATAGRRAKAADVRTVVLIETTAPTRGFVLTTGPEVDVAMGSGDGNVDARLTMPSEAFIRLLSGRLDPEHTPVEVLDADLVAQLRQVFPGF